jgi:hypothetical protein
MLELSVEKQSATISSSNRTPTDPLPIPLRIFDTRQATTRPTQDGTAPLKSHVVEQQHPKAQRIVSDHIPIEPSGVELAEMCKETGSPQVIFHDSSSYCLMLFNGYMNKSYTGLCGYGVIE